MSTKTNKKADEIVVTSETMEDAILASETKKTATKKDLEVANKNYIETAVKNGVNVDEPKFNGKGEIVTFKQADGGFKDAHNRNTNSTGFTAGRLAGIAKNAIENAYKLEPEMLAELANTMVDECIRIQGLFTIVKEGKKEDLDAMAKRLAKIAAQQTALQEKIRLATLKASKASV